MKFVLYYDFYNATAEDREKEFFGTCSAGEYAYEPIEAEDLLEAIEIADERWHEGIYLMRIMRKVGKIERPYHEGYAFETYEAVMCKRSYGWHRNDEKHSEGEHRVTKNWLTSNKDRIWFTTI